MTEFTESEARAIEILDAAATEHDAAGVWAMFSGGHDSATCAWVASHAARFRGCVHINTGIGIDQTRQYVRELCEAQGWPLKEYAAEDQGQRYRDIVLAKGFPGPALHYQMYQRLKERALRAFVRGHKRHRRDRLVLATGARAQESRRRMGHVQPVRREGVYVWANPLHDWSKSDCHDLMQRRGLPFNDVVRLLHMSGECLCGAFAKPGELAEIELWFPEAAKQIRELEAEARARGFDWGWGQRPPRVSRKVRVDSAGRKTRTTLDVAPALCVGCAGRQESSEEHIDTRDGGGDRGVARRNRKSRRRMEREPLAVDSDATQQGSGDGEARRTGPTVQTLRAQGLMLCGSAFETLLQPIVHLYWVDPPNRWSIHPKPRTASWHTKQAAACLRELERVQRTARLEGLHAAHRWLCAELQSEQRELARRAASLYDNEVADAWRVLQGIEKRAREALVAIPPAVRSTFVAVCAALCVLGCSSTTTGLGLYTETDGASDSAAEQRLDGQGADARSDAVADASAPDVRVPDATPDKLPAVDSASETAPVPDAAPDPCATCGCVGSSVACGRPSKPNCYGFDHDASCCSCPVGCPEPPGAWSACQQRDFDPPNVFWCCAP